jgi:LDH2 family malate/lactate/ureidoglycolate dehydrogenase
MTTQPISQSMDADLRHSQAALERAAHRAREIAAQTGTAIVISRQGVIAPTTAMTSATTQATRPEPSQLPSVS